MLGDIGRSILAGRGVRHRDRNKGSARGSGSNPQRHLGHDTPHVKSVEDTGIDIGDARDVAVVHNGRPLRMLDLGDASKPGD